MDCGALVAIWIRSKNGESGWVGKFRGILQLQKNKVFAGDYSSKKGNDLRLSSDKDFSFAIGAVRAWKAEPTPKVRMAGLIPSMWPGMTQTIGEYSAKMIHDEVPNIEGLKVREVSVFGQKPVSSVAFTKVRHLFDE
jgi:hypothetical protein